MAKWVDGARPRPPIDIEYEVGYLRSYALDLKIGGRSMEEIADALHRLSGEALKISRELDIEPHKAALAGVRRMVRRALAGKTAEAR